MVYTITETINHNSQCFECGTNIYLGSGIAIKSMNTYKKIHFHKKKCFSSFKTKMWRVDAQKIVLQVKEVFTK